MEKLCRNYWYPLYAHVRRRGFSPEDAQDLTQEFFARLIQKNFVAEADHHKGRFRTFLLTALIHFLADEWDRLKAQKRGGGRPAIPLDGKTAETRYQLEPVDTRSPERLFARQWAVTLLERVLARLRKEFQDEGKQNLFEALNSCLTQARAAVPYSDLAPLLNMSEGALRVAVHRLRQRYRQLLRMEIAETVASPEEIEEELRHLFRMLAE